MTPEDFDKHITKVFLEITKLSSTKGLEYSGPHDRFANFTNTGTDVDISRLKIAWIFVKKHLDSIKSFIRLGETKSTESIHSRIHDAILYLLLIDGMITEDELRYNTLDKFQIGPEGK